MNTQLFLFNIDFRKFTVFRERFGTEIITETVSKVDLSKRPFKYWREGEEDDETAFETADT